jgi:hypothetical protein
LNKSLSFPSDSDIEKQKLITIGIKL